MRRKETILAAVNELRPFLDGMLEKAGIPGYALRAVFDDGDSLTITGGTKHRGGEQPPDENTIFMIGSCSKTFTAVAAAILSNEGALDLDAPLSDLLPIPLERDGKQVSLLHLLTNSSGLPNQGLSEIGTGKFLYGKLPGVYVDNYPFDEDRSLVGFMRDAAGELVGTPGGQFIYSNEGFSLAGEALAVASGKPFPSLIRDLIFLPFGMHSSGYSKADLPADSDISSGHLADGTPAPAYFEPVIAGAGGILSTAGDLGRFVLAMLCEGMLDGKRVLPLDVIRELELGRIPHKTAASMVGPGVGPEWYGMGLMIYSDYLGTRVITHGGSTGNFSSGFFLTRELGFGIAALCNGSGGEAILELFAFMIAARALGKDPFAIFPLFAVEKKFRQLEGVYSSRGEVVKAKISYKWGRLWWESIDGNGNSPLGTHPLDAAGDAACRKFSFLNGPGAASEVIFYTGEDGLMRVHRDRNVLTRRKKDETD
jgi:CubicO group peptidase (beta-lactamase class C family)